MPRYHLVKAETLSLIGHHEIHKKHEKIYPWILSLFVYFVFFVVKSDCVVAAYLLSFLDPALITPKHYVLYPI